MNVASGNLPMASDLPCAAPGSVVRATEQALITYQRRAARHHACAEGHRARFLGAYDPGAGGVFRPQLGGRFAGFGERTCDRESCGGRTTLVDLSTGRAVHVETEGAAERFYRTVVVGRQGFVAWSFSFAEHDGGEIHLLDRRGRHELLSAGAGVEVRSLALAGRRLYWVADGVVQTRVVG